MSFSFNRDRIAELRGETLETTWEHDDRRHRIANDEFGPTRPPTSNTTKVESTTRYNTEEPLHELKTPSPTDLSTMPGFFEEIDNVKMEIATVGTSVQEIQSLHESALAAINATQARTFASQLATLKTQTQQRNFDIKKRIQWLENVNDTYLTNTSDRQMRQTLTMALRKKFIDIIQEYQEMERRFDQRYRQRLERQIRIVKPDATEDEIDDIIDSDRSNQVFTQTLMQSSRSGQAKAVLTEVQDRHQDIKQIEKTILELHQLFIDMSLLVDQQGKTLKQVEQHAEDTSGNMEQGNQFISRAIKNAQATRRKKWWCVCICIILFVIIAILIWWFVFSPLGIGK